VAAAEGSNAQRRQLVPQHAIWLATGRVREGQRCERSGRANGTVRRVNLKRGLIEHDQLRAVIRIEIHRHERTWPIRELRQT
jgi:hypothetical protein